MQRGNDLRALTNGRGYALDRTCSDIPDGEYAASAGLERASIRIDVCTGHHKTPRVEENPRIRQPIGIRCCPDKKKQMPNRPPHLLTRTVAPVDGFQDAVCAFQTSDLGLLHDLDVRETLDALDKVA